MNRIITIFVITFFQQSLFAQTNVKGTYSEDTRWTIQGSPYNVTGNVGVPDGVTLTIDPGVIVNFNTANQIIVQGALVIAGTAKEPVIINGNQMGAAMILFQKTNLSNSSMNYVSVKGPKNGLEFRDFDNIKNTGRLVINRLKLSNSCISALGTNIQAVIEVNNSDFTNSNVNNANKDEAIVINNSKITGGVITAQSDVQSITLNKDTCYNTSFGFGGYGMLQADACLFYNVRFTGAGAGKLILKSSSLFNSGINLWHCQVNMTACVVRFDADYKESYCIRTGMGLISSSDFTGNGNRTAIDLAYSGYYVKFIVADCEFRGFKTYLRGREWVNGKDTIMFINRCNFMDPVSDSSIINLTKYNINASNNWWGTASESLIKNSIQDFWDDIIYGKVIYNGFLSGPIDKTELLKINSVSVTPNKVSAIDPVRIVTTTNVPGNGKRVFKTHYFYRNTVFVESCYSQGIGLAVTSVADTFDIGYLSLGNHPVVFKATLSSSSSDCIQLKMRISSANFHVSPPVTNLYNLTSIPFSPIKGDNVKIITEVFFPTSGHRIGKNYFIRNDTIFLGLCYSAVSSSQKLYRDTFDMGYLDNGDYTVMLSAGLSLSPGSCVTDNMVIFKSKLNILLAKLTNYKITSLPQKPFAGEDISINTEVRVKPFGKVISQSHFIRNDTIYIEQCFYAGSGTKDEIVKSTANIGKLTNESFKIYPIRFIVRLSKDSNACKTVNKEVYAWSVHVNPSLDLNTLSDGNVTISPNPFTDKVSVNEMEIGRLEIYDLRGQLIKSFERPEGNLIEGLGSLPPGLFIFQLSTPDGKLIRKKMLKN